MDLQITGTIGLVLVLVVATSTIALADESFIVESFFDPISSEEIPKDTVRGHIENFSWIQRVSSEGVIEIKGISFVVINDDDVNHSFQICTVIEGPTGQFSPSFDSPLACATTEIITKENKSDLQIIEFSKGVKVSDLVDITISIQEVEFMEN
ncbi:MAG: hypothetical protein COA77_08415 [Thaumarchaeota archaeon]|nr:MAG: hypothetical protein COA77_08415 [Nitrososphaerota archaeon]